ncbi:MAG: T9SS type A sorting domain-containing protein [Williamsia sp.]|nr:T9SS type A sorting domain-containing protein [Williamsia sp.]
MMLSNPTTAQSYYSGFSSTSGNYSSTSPSGLLCLSPSFSNDQNIATADLTDYAQVAGTLSVALTCNTSDYSIRAALNLPAGTTEVPAGYSAGFHVQFGSVASLALLQSNLSLKTYFAGVPRETVPAANLAGISILTGGSPTDIFFTATLSFDEVELDFNTSVLPLGAAFDYRFFYAFAAPATLPVKLTTVTASGQASSLTLTWTTTSETGTDRFEVQRNSGNDIYVTIGVIRAAAAVGSLATYTYVDKSAYGSSKQTYRLKIVDRNGSVAYSKVISIAGSDAPGIRVYPSYVSKGQAITVTANGNNLMYACLLDATGRAVSSYMIKAKTLVPTDHLNHGMYLLKVTNGKNAILTQKLIVQ